LNNIDHSSEGARIGVNSIGNIRQYSIISQETVICRDSLDRRFVKGRALDYWDCGRNCGDGARLPDVGLRGPFPENWVVGGVQDGRGG